MPKIAGFQVELQLRRMLSLPSALELNKTEARSKVLNICFV